MKIKIDYSGQKFNKLQILSLFDYVNGRQRYLCKCECGKEKLVMINNLRFNLVKSCGCLKGRNEIGNNKKKQNNENNIRKHIGEKFGLLTIVDVIKRGKCWDIVCICECGNKINKRYRDLEKGINIACGCLNKISGSIVNKKKTNNNKNRAEKYIGEVFKKLIIIGIKKKNNRWFMVCQCECGKIINEEHHVLVRGERVSCGCMKYERASILGSTIGIHNSKQSSKGKWIYQCKNGNSIYMRSAYELMFAEILDNRNVIWKYEPKIFKLKDGVRYKPDFLINNDEWYEVKGLITESAKNKMSLFKSLGYKLILITLEDIEKEHPLTYYKFTKEYKLKNDKSCSGFKSR